MYANMDILNNQLIISNICLKLLMHNFIKYFYFLLNKCYSYFGEIMYFCEGNIIKAKTYFLWNGYTELINLIKLRYIIHHSKLSA